MREHQWKIVGFISSLSMLLSRPRARSTCPASAHACSSELYVRRSGLRKIRKNRPLDDISDDCVKCWKKLSSVIDYAEYLKIELSVI